MRQQVLGLGVYGGCALRVRYSPRIKRFYERKAAKTNRIVAAKAVAHKLARAAYHVMRERVPFDETRAFA